MDNKEELKAFGERVKLKRIEIGLSQEAFAIRCGYTDRSSIAKIEKGEIDISRSKIIALSTALGVSPSYLMGWDMSCTNNGTNNGIIGNHNSNNVIQNGTEKLGEVEAELLALCGKMSLKEKTKLLTYAYSLVEE